MKKVLLALVLFYCASCGNKDNSQNSVSNDSTNTNDSVAAADSLDDAITLYGVVQSTGLRAEEKKALGLMRSEFQLISSKSYFLEGTEEFSSYWGKCVVIKGRLKEGWFPKDEQVNGQFTYGRVPFIVDSIGEENYDKCNYDAPLVPLNDDFPREILHGKINRITRPGPDIAYDYKLIFDEPYIDSIHASGMPTKIHFMILSGFDFSIQRELEEALRNGISIDIEGYREVGFAETTHFRVIRIKDLTKTKSSF